MAHASNGAESIVGTNEASGAAGFLEELNQHSEAECNFNEEKLPCAETVLLVEDECFVREVAGEVLRCAGYKVLVARAALEAIQIYDLCSGDIDLLLSDVILPGKSGRALARDLEYRNPGIRVLFITGYAKQLAEIESDGSAQQCLAKPFSAQALLRKVRHVLDARTRGSHPASG